MELLSAFARWLAQRRLFALGLCLAVLTLALLRQAIATKATGERRRGEVASKEHPKSRSFFNPALGHLVFVPPELGIEVEAANAEWDEKETAKRIENQLLGLRRLYQREAEKKPELMGQVVLQLSVDSSGEVTHAQELFARLPDAEFRKQVVAIASGWKFDASGKGPARIVFPLLFIREGMDIGTVVAWERSLSARREADPEKPRASADDRRSRGGSAAAAEPAKAAGGRSVEALHRVRSITAVRSRPRYSAATVETLPAGAEVVVVGREGDWLRVRLPGRESGYIRKEFAVPVEGGAPARTSTSYESRATITSTPPSAGR